MQLNPRSFKNELFRIFNKMHYFCKFSAQIKSCEKGGRDRKKKFLLNSLKFMFCSSKMYFKRQETVWQLFGFILSEKSATKCIFANKNSNFFRKKHVFLVQDRQKFLSQKFLRWRAGVIVSRKDGLNDENISTETPKLKSCLENFLSQRIVVGGGGPSHRLEKCRFRKI